MSSVALEKRRLNSFWWWLWREGLARFFDWWLLVHAAAGFTMSWLIPGRLSSIAGPALIPLASILVGLTFAWSANAASLLQSQEMHRVGAFQDGGKFRTYVFTYQGAVLLVLLLTTIWSVIAAGAVDRFEITNSAARATGRVILFALSSLTLRECWHACVGVQQMLLAQFDYRKELDKANGITTEGAQRTLEKIAERDNVGALRSAPEQRSLSVPLVDPNGSQTEEAQGRFDISESEPNVGVGEDPQRRG